MADREIRKKNFQTIESDPEELSRKIRAHRLKIFRNSIITAGVLILAAAGILLFLRLREYTSYTVAESIERSDTSATRFVAYADGVVKYSNDGAAYTNAAGEEVWNQTYEMQEPMIDNCGDYLAFAEKGGSKVYILNRQGLQGEVETNMKIDRVRVAGQGTVAVLMEKDGVSNIRLYDKKGNNLVGGQIHLEKSGYPLDIALSDDAIKLAVSLLNISEGKVKTMIAFYNFGSVGQNEFDHMVSSYSYSDVVVPEIGFVTNNRMIAFGDTKVLIYEGTQKPALEKEIKLDKEIKSVFYNQNYFGLVNNNEDKDNTRHMEIYDTRGSHVMSKDFTMDYNEVEFLTNNEICIRNDTQCLIYNTYGVRHFAYTFDVPLFQIIAGKSALSYTFIMEGTTEKVRLK